MFFIRVLLGMDEKVTQKILSNFYRGRDTPVDIGESSPLKRSRLSMSENASSAGAAFAEDERESTEGGDEFSDGDGSRSKRIRPNQ